MTTPESLFNVACDLAPLPATREDATRHAWVQHYAATALAAYATLRVECRTIAPNPEAGSRPDIGYLSLLANAATSAAVALLGAIDAPGLIWDLTPEAGALNGEWEEWLAEILVRYGINPGDIDPNLNPADFAEAVRVRG
jgi:hypothetical protein